jgi:hypothetical protein
LFWWFAAVTGVDVIWRVLLNGRERQRSDCDGWPNLEGKTPQNISLISGERINKNISAFFAQIKEVAPVKFAERINICVHEHQSLHHLFLLAHEAPTDSSS